MRSTFVPNGLADLDRIDLAEPGTYAEHELSEYWRLLRREQPLYRHPEFSGRRGFWVLSRYDDIVELYKDTANFTSEHGNVLITLLADGDSAAGRMIPVTDGTRHKEMRTVLQKAFSPKALKRIEARVRSTSRTLVARAIDKGESDFALDVASRIPMETICDLLGIPQQDREYLLTMTKSAISSDDSQEYSEAADRARNDILQYFLEQLDDRREHPGDDVLSGLAHIPVEGDAPLNDDEIVLNCYSLILGGDATSRLAMVDSLHSFAAHPDQWEAFKSGAVSPERAVEEVLRWASPTMHFGRTATRDTEILGTPIPAGDVVTVWNVSANRDEAVFHEPDRFLLDRSPNKHIAFGRGPHFCIGAYLARLEITEVLLAVRDFAAGLEVVGPVQRIYSNLLTGISSLPVRFETETADVHEMVL